MTMYRAEILGKVPYGLTHNDVYATILQMVNEGADNVHSVVKRRLAGGLVSVVTVFESANSATATTVIRSAGTAVYQFSFDILGPKEVPS